MIVDHNEFLSFVREYLSCTDPDAQVEMRWNNDYDGSTEWHLLRHEPSMARYGLFPYQAQYRMKNNGLLRTPNPHP